MTAAITNHNGQDMFAYNVENGHPWHRLGEQVGSYMTIDEALHKIGVGNEVVTSEDVWVRNPHFAPGQTGGDPQMEWVQVPGKSAVFSSVFGTMGVHSSKYEIMERREIMQIAFDVIGLDPDSRSLDTIGNLGDVGEKFFAYIREDDLVIDPNGIADTIEQGFVVATSFDGKLPSTIGRSSIRVVCSNTLSMALKGLGQGIKAAHYPGAEQRLRFLAQVNDYAGAADKLLVEKAEAMLKVNGDKALNRLMDGFFPMTDDLTDAVYTKRMQARGLLMHLYSGPDNLSKDKVGSNGWAAYNAWTEYLDHRLEVRGQGRDKEMIRAERSVFPGEVWKQKAKAQELVLA